MLHIVAIIDYITAGVRSNYEDLKAVGTLKPFLTETGQSFSRFFLLTFVFNSKIES